MNEYIERAAANFRSNSGRYARSERYYSGRHDLTFATAKFQNTFGSMFREFALNLCPAVCDAVRDKLKIKGFTVESGEPGMSAEAARTIWTRSRMGTRCGELHKEAPKNGDAYAIVWPAADGAAAIFPNSADGCTVFYDDESPGKVLWAAKRWRTRDRRTRLNLLFPDRVERLVTRRECGIRLPDAGEFVRFTEDGESPTIENPYGAVPVFHFANNADLGSFGTSELEAAIPIQDGLNKSVLDMLVAMEFCAYRQRWAAGIEIEYDADGNAVEPYKAGIDHLWISQNPNARFGDFDSADLDQFLKVKDGFRIDIASVTGTPLYYLMPHSRGFPSGEALRKAEARFIAKVRDRQASFGETWSDVMSFALAVSGHSADVRVRPVWEDPAPVAEREILENILIKKEIGLSSAKALAEAGYGQSDVETMLENNK